MKFQCAGQGCTQTVNDVKDIPYICACGLKGRSSYYPLEYIEHFSRVLYESKKVTSLLEGYFKVREMLQEKIYDKEISE